MFNQGNSFLFSMLIAFKLPTQVGIPKFSKFLAYLRTLLQDLPEDLPVEDSPVSQSKYFSFMSFQINEELLDQTGTEIGAFKLFKTVFGWKT